MAFTAKKLQLPLNIEWLQQPLSPQSDLYTYIYIYTYMYYVLDYM